MAFLLLLARVRIIIAETRALDDDKHDLGESESRFFARTMIGMNVHHQGVGSFGKYIDV